MNSDFDVRAARAEKHRQMSQTLASLSLHMPLPDPDRVLADAAADDLLEVLAASGFIRKEHTATLLSSVGRERCSDEAKS